MSKPKRITSTLIRALLRELGDTPKAIATSLRRRRLKGMLGVSNFCPLARYLKAKTGELTTVTEGYVDCDGLHNVPMPQPCRDFVEAFDNNEFPDLVAAESRCVFTATSTTICVTS